MTIISELSGCGIHCPSCGSEVRHSHSSARSYCEQALWLWFPVHHQWRSGQYFENDHLARKLIQLKLILCDCRRFAFESPRWSCAAARKAWARPHMLSETWDLVPSLESIWRFALFGFCLCFLFTLMGTCDIGIGLNINSSVLLISWHLSALHPCVTEPTGRNLSISLEYTVQRGCIFPVVYSYCHCD